IAWFGGTILVSQFATQLQKWRRIGIGLLLITGLALFWLHPVQYYHSISFRLKMILLVPLIWTKPASALSLLLWVAIIFASRGIRILCDYLTIVGHLTKQDGRYGLTPNSKALLSKRSPVYMGSMGDFLASEGLLQAFLHLPEAVKQGGAPPDPEGPLAPDHPMWVAFARSMAPLMDFVGERVAAQLTASGPATKVLDIAAGHGMYGIN